MRRTELIGYVFNVQIWHSSAQWTARIRALLLILGGHETEICGVCGGAVTQVWWCQDKALWTKITGWGNGGVMCTGCFDRLADKAGISLQWSCKAGLDI